MDKQRKLLEQLIESVLRLELYPDLHEDDKTTAPEGGSDPGTSTMDVQTIAANIDDELK